MWNKRNEGEPRPATPQSPKSSPPAHAPAPTRPLEQSTSVAVLGPSVVVKGDIHSEQDLTIEGEVQGIVEAIGYRLTIGPNGNLQTKGVKAREVVVLGKMNGSIEASEK